MTGLPDVGLCRSCLHLKQVGNRRGSRFYLCKRSADDPSFARYPTLPVLTCPGYERGPDDPWAPYAEPDGG